jgi:precorrin-4 C11-methyltransferase
MIEKADVLIYAGSLVNPQVLRDKKRDANVYDSASMNLKEIATLAAREIKKGKMVVRIHSGDPSIYGAIQEQMVILDKKGIPYEVIPGVSSVFAAAAALKRELTVPECSQTVILTRISGRTKVPSRESIATLAQSQATMAIYLSVAHLEKVVEQLRSSYASDTPIAVVHKASWPDEKVIRGTLATIAGKVRKAVIKRQAIILVGRAMGEQIGDVRSKLYDEGFFHGFRKTQKKKKGNLAIVALTKSGAELGTVLKKKFPDAHLYVPTKLAIKGVRIKCFSQDLRELFGDLLNLYDRFVCIMATGIVVRTIPPFLTHKSVDPAVVVLDEKGRFAVSLIAGHLGGANQLAREVVSVTGGESVITTATDVHGMFALDVLAQQLDCAEMDYGLVKRCNYALLHGEKVGIYPDLLKPNISVGKKHAVRFYKTNRRLLTSDCSYKIIISNKHLEQAGLNEQRNGTVIVLKPRNLVVGIGCNRKTTSAEIEKAVKEVLKSAKLSFQAIKKIATVSTKSDEKGLVAFVHKHNIAIEFFTPQQLNTVNCPTPPSRDVLKVLGSKGVCEPAALLGAGVKTLLCSKKKTPNVTVAIAEIPLERLLAEGKEHSA